MAATPYTQTNVNYDIVQALLNQQTVQDNITAKAGGGQTTATAVTATFVNIGVCATANDSVQLPLAVAGASVFIRNNGAASAQVYAANGSTDTINGTAGSTGVAQAASAGRVYFCTVSAPAGKWQST